jgi:hypothetical protein
MAELGIVEMRKVRDAGIQWILADLNKVAYNLDYFIQFVL